MTFQTVSDALKFWMPLLTGITLVVRLGFAVKRQIAMYAHQLLNNHLSHIQKSAEESATQLTNVANTNEQILVTMRDMSDTLKKSTEIQMKVLTGVEILKDR